MQQEELVAGKDFETEEMNKPMNPTANAKTNLRDMDDDLDEDMDMQEEKLDMFGGGVEDLDKLDKMVIGEEVEDDLDLDEIDNILELNETQYPKFTLAKNKARFLRMVSWYRAKEEWIDSKRLPFATSSSTNVYGWSKN